MTDCWKWRDLGAIDLWHLFDGRIPRIPSVSNHSWCLEFVPLTLSVFAWCKKADRFQSLLCLPPSTLALSTSCTDECTIFEYSPAEQVFVSKCSILIHCWWYRIRRKTRFGPNQIKLRSTLLYGRMKISIPNEMVNVASAKVGVTYLVHDQGFSTTSKTQTSTWAIWCYNESVLSRLDRTL